MREIVKIARKIDQKLATTGDIYPSQPALILRVDHDEMVSEVLKWACELYGKIDFNIIPCKTGVG